MLKVLPFQQNNEEIGSVQGVLQGRGVKKSSNLHYPPFLEALFKHQIPTVLVATKSDSPQGSWEVDHEMAEELTSTVTGIESFPVSLSAPETHKRCISIILRNIMVKRRGKLCP